MGETHPAGLAEAGRGLWSSVSSGRDLNDSQREILFLACKQCDRAAEARLVLTKDSVIGKDRFDQAKAHPAVQVERMASMSCAKLVEQVVGKMSAIEEPEVVEEDLFD